MFDSLTPQQKKLLFRIRDTVRDAARDVVLDTVEAAARTAVEGKVKEVENV